MVMMTIVTGVLAVIVFLLWVLGVGSFFAKKKWFWAVAGIGIPIIGIVYGIIVGFKKLFK